MVTQKTFIVYYTDSSGNEMYEQVHAVEMTTWDNGSLVFFDVNQKIIRLYAKGWWRRAY